MNIYLCSKCSTLAKVETTDKGITLTPCKCISEGEEGNE